MWTTGDAVHYEASTTIEATPDEVWAVLADGPGWADWDSGVISVDGELAPGSEIRLVSSVSPTRTFKLKVTAFEPGHRLELSSGMPLGLFTGVRGYDLEPVAGGTRFTMREEYSGPMARMITKSIPDLQPSFDQFVTGLKARVEAAAEKR
jgi:hypothetical protein